MKKIVIILLLVLPFILIYSISFTGKILSEYAHIYVERIVLLDETEKEYEQGSLIKLGKGQEYVLNVKIFPELASNKEFTVSNSNQTVCEIDEETYTVKGLEYGVSQIVLTSKDRPVSFSFGIKVSDDHIQSISVSKTEVRLGVGKSEGVDIEILPITTLQEYRDVTWSSADEGIAKVNANGIIKGVSVGETFVKVSSSYNPQVFTEIKVIVTQDIVYPVSFNLSEETLVTYESVLDLSALTKITVEGYSDLKYKVTAGEANADLTQISQGIVTFKAYGVYKIEVSLVHNGQVYSDKLTVLFKQNMS